MLELQNICKFYYSETSVTQALRKINLKFELGEFVAITGESGSGKSTLLNVISGMDTFDDGEMFYNGSPTFQYDDEEWEEYRRSKIGFVFQDYSLIGHYTVLENVTSALLIMGEKEDVAEKQAVRYLEHVGLKGYEKQRASELSSGQKQRLSIARALAKNTDIIVADEPTGNLDSETGEQIIKLLKTLSKDKLVIMVTHNYDQVEEYVTRKIRLHDGEVVMDVAVNENELSIRNNDTDFKIVDSGNKSQTKDDISVDNKDNIDVKKHHNKVARHFAWMNARTQIGRALLFQVFFLITAVISFVFIGEILTNADDTFTKEYDTEIYAQQNDKRLSVSRSDGSVITTDDLNKLLSVSSVEQVDQYDYCNDINYYIEEDKDYTFSYGTVDGNQGYYSTDNEGVITYNEGDDPSNAYDDADDEHKTIEFVNTSKYMHSSTCISKSDLSTGDLPEERNELVMYSDGEYKVGDTVRCYFTASNIWNDGEYYYKDMKITGLLKDKTTQVYFAPALCQMLSTNIDSGTFFLSYCFDDRTQKYLGKSAFIPVIGDEITNVDEAKVSKNFIVPSTDTFVPENVEEAVPGTDILELTPKSSASDTNPETISTEIKVLDDMTDYTGSFLELSEKMYNKYYSKDSSQAAVYISNYSKTNKVIKKLEKMGYQAISSYRMSSGDYDSDKVNNRLVLLGISLLVLLLLIVLGILIIRSLMKIRIKDYFVMKSMGMRMHVIKKISFYEMTGYCATAIVVTIVAMQIIGHIGVSLINNMLAYYTIGYIAIYIVYNLILEMLTVLAFNHLLKGRMNS